MTEPRSETKKYKDQTPDERRTYHREYWRKRRDQDPEYGREAYLKWRNDPVHLEKHRNYLRAHRAKQRAAGVEPKYLTTTKYKTEQRERVRAYYAKQMLLPEFRKERRLKTKAYRDKKKTEKVAACNGQLRNQNIMQFFTMST